jgi:type VI secretion system VasD/TssJ family lipoprotein
MTQAKLSRVLIASAVAALLSTTIGCGWLFNKQEKPLRVEVVFTGADSLNFDGRSVQACQVKAYILKDIQRFTAADVRAFFNPEFDPGFMEAFARDTLGSVTMIVAPGETRSATIEIPHAFAKREPRIYFGSLANFAQPPSERGKERMSFKMKKKSQQTLRVQVNKNTIAQGKKK